DWAFLYRVSLSKAESLISSGVKVYIADGAFSHGKVMLTENCAIVGSVNMDMRSFYHEYDNAVYTDDKKVMEEVAQDFEGLFSAGLMQVKKRGFVNALITAVLKLLSPLM
ncbi:MAG: hypothetical protein K2G96_00495, partial [Clostridia bacterium]|nr:hypothetical protein [Clostridia bacterium]